MPPDLDGLCGLAETALNATSELTADQRSGREGDVERAERVLAYVNVVLAASDQDLLSESADNNLRQALGPFASDPVTAIQGLPGAIDAVIDTVSRTPVSRGRDWEQSAKAAAASFQRSATGRLVALRAKLEDADSDVGVINERLATRSEEIDAHFTSEIAATENRLAEIQASANAEVSRVQELVSSQQAAFETAQGERSTEFRDSLEVQDKAVAELLSKREKELVALLNRSDADAADLIAEMTRMRDESAALVGGIGLAGTAERYRNEADAQAKAANRWRNGTILTAAAAVGMAVFAAFSQHDPETLAAKLVVSLILGGLAAYLARQSLAHRRREERARALELDLTAFSPFVELLPSDLRDHERVLMTRRAFHGTSRGGDQVDEYGPSVASLLRRRASHGTEASADGE